MTVAEFKAFLEGMDVKDWPTKDQWARIVKKVDELEVIKPPQYPKVFYPNPDTYTSVMPCEIPLPYSTCATTS